jgi:hypothetical protein
MGEGVSRLGMAFRCGKCRRLGLSCRFAEVAEIGNQEPVSQLRKFIGELPVRRGFRIGGGPGSIEQAARRLSFVGSKLIDGLHEPWGSAKSLGALLALRFEGEMGVLEQGQNEDLARPLQHHESLGEAARRSMKWPFVFASARQGTFHPAHANEKTMFACRQYDEKRRN